MNSDGYFTPSIVSPRWSEQGDKNEVPLYKSLRGKVEFDLGKLMDPNSKTEISINGELPRIQPRNEREHVEPHHIQQLQSSLTAWVVEFFDYEKQPKYFEDLIQTSSFLTIYSIPLEEIGETRMDLFLKCIFWYWHIDDVLELAVVHSLPVDTLDQGLSQIMSVLKDDVREFREVEGFPGFRPLFNSLVDLHGKFLEFNPDYKSIGGPFRLCLERYFEAMKWVSVDPIRGNYTEGTFKYWRSLLADLDGIIELIFMLDGATLPQRIRTSPLLRRILDIVNSIGGFTNDVLGLAKEFKYGHVDNLVMFKTIEKGVPLGEAVAQVCELVRSKLQDYIQLRNTLLLKFSHHPSLVKYIDVLESFLDGHNQIYARSERHLSTGKIKLSR